MGELVCADFGCSTGGFTDCLLQNGAVKVYAIDTGYNVIDYKLRSDDRVVVMERTNALFVVLPWDKNKREKREDPHPSPLPKGEGIRKDPHLAQASRLRRPQPLSQGERGAREDPIRSPSPSGRGARGEGASKYKVALDPEYLAFVRKLRKEQTDAEQLMWYMLRDRRLLDLKFRRQQPIEPYVLDFYCAELKLAIELDGGQHNEPKNKKKDEKRTKFLEKQGIHLMRFWDHEVLKDTEAVLEAICYFVQEEREEKKGKDPHPQPLSQGERGVREDPHPNPLPKGEGIRGEEIRGVDLITIDLSWTRQQHAIPAALNWLKSDASKTGRIISLIKPHYETNKQEKADWLVDGALPSERAEQVLNRVLSEFPSYGAEVLGCTISPIKGGKSSRKKKGHGNVEYLVLARPITQNH